MSVLGLASALAGDAALAGVAVELAVFARRPQRAAVIAREAARGLRDAGTAHTASCAATLEAALDGAVVVVDLVRVGGAAAREHDELRCSWRDAPGDEGLGPGGVANAWRTAPFTRDLAESIAAVAPQALVANLAAPLGVTTRILADAGLRCVGLCELPLVTEQQLLAVGAPAVGYVGSNHLGLFVARDLSGTHELALAAEAAGLAARRTVERLGGVPLPYYHRVVRPDLGEEIGIRAPRGRASELAELSDRVVSAIGGSGGSGGGGAGGAGVPARRPTPWFDLAFVPALRAVLTGDPARLAVNLPNRSSTGRLVPWLPAEAVVEVIGAWGPEGFRAEPLATVPPAAAAWVRAVAEADRLTHAAAVGRDEQALTAALDAWAALDPPPGPDGPATSRRLDGSAPGLRAAVTEPVEGVDGVVV